MLVEIHMIQNYVPSNLNRDDTGSPKQCLFGGYPRGRISSQCIKSALRKSKIFSEALKDYGKGIRTRKMPELVKKELIKMGVEKEMAELAAKKATGFGNKSGKEQDKLQTKQIMFFSPDDIVQIAKILKNAIDDAEDIKSFKKVKPKHLIKEFKNAKIHPITADIALFGRMITSDAFADVEASMQVAHAISTNRLEPEYDFFTAVDDKSEEQGDMEDMGAGMMGEIEFNSSCYYKYFSFDVDSFLENMKGSVEKSQTTEMLQSIFSALLKAVIFKNPEGKQNTFAAHQLPAVVLIEFRPEKIPISYANAFVKPAKPYGKQDLIENSVEKFISHVDAITNRFNLNAKSRLWFAGQQLEHLETSSPENVEDCADLDTLIQKASIEVIKD